MHFNKVVERRTSIVTCDERIAHFLRLMSALTLVLTLEWCALIGLLALPKLL